MDNKEVSLMRNITENIRERILMDDELVKLENKKIEKSVNEIYKKLLLRNYVMNITSPIMIKLLDKNKI
jgi:hypothetical protein